MLSLNRDEKVTCDNCVTWTTRNNVARHKTGILLEPLHVPFVPSSQQNPELKWTIRWPQKHSATNTKAAHDCKRCDENFHGFYFQRQQRRKEHGTLRRSRAGNVYVSSLMATIDDNSLKKELQMCKHCWVGSEMVDWRHRSFNFAMDLVHQKILV